MNKAFVLALLTVLVVGCRKEPDFGNLTSNDLIATKYDPSADFSSYHTYSINPQVALVSNAQGADTVLQQNYADQLIATIRTNMNARGYTESADLDSADLGFNIVVIKEINTSDVVYPGSWWGYPGYADPYYWGGCFDCYYSYPYYYSYSYTTGTIVLEMIDLNSAQNNDKLIVRWAGIGNGMLSDYNSSNIKEAKAAIDQMFTQSPYIVHQ